ncbi:uncharacterized protein METZ01_LOCUS345428, partial [marine metagenome]
MNKTVGILLIIFLLIVACNRSENTDPLTITEISTTSIDTLENSLIGGNKALSSGVDTDIEPPASAEVTPVALPPLD